MCLFRKGHLPQQTLPQAEFIEHIRTHQSVQQLEVHHLKYFHLQETMTPPVLLGQPANSSLALPQLSLVRQATPTTPLQLSPRSPALSYERLLLLLRITMTEPLFTKHVQPLNNSFTLKKGSSRNATTNAGKMHSKAYTQQPVSRLSNSLTILRQSTPVLPQWQTLRAETQESWEKSRAESVPQRVLSSASI